MNFVAFLLYIRRLLFFYDPEFFRIFRFEKNLSFLFQNISRRKYIDNIVHSSTEIFILVLIGTNELLEQWMVCGCFSRFEVIANLWGNIFQVLHISTLSVHSETFGMFVRFFDDLGFFTNLSISWFNLWAFGVSLLS